MLVSQPRSATVLTFQRINFNLPPSKICMEVTSKTRRRTPKEIETFRINSLAVLRFLPEQQLYTFTKSQRLWKRDKLCPLNTDYTKDLMLWLQTSYWNWVDSKLFSDYFRRLADYFRKMFDGLWWTIWWTKNKRKSEFDEPLMNQGLCDAAAAFKHKLTVWWTKLHPAHSCPDRDFACLLVSKIRQQVH